MWAWRRNLNSEFYHLQYQSGSNTISKLFPEDIKVTRTLLEARKVAGSATYKQYDIVLSFSKFICSVDPVVKTKRVC